MAFVDDAQPAPVKVSEFGFGLTGEDRVVFDSALFNFMRPSYDPIVERRQDGESPVFAYEVLPHFVGKQDEMPIQKRWKTSGLVRAMDKSLIEATVNELREREVALRPTLALTVAGKTVASDAAAYLSELKKLDRFVRSIVVMPDVHTREEIGPVRRFCSTCHDAGYSVAIRHCTPWKPYGSAGLVSAVEPDLVCLDHQFLVEALAQRREKEVHSYVRELHADNYLVLAGGLENHMLKAMALDCGADYLQGSAVAARVPQLGESKPKGVFQRFARFARDATA